MKKIKSINWKTCIIEITIIFLMVMFLCVGGCKSKSEKVISSIKANLPIGTSFTQIEDYLKKNNFEYSYNKETTSFTAISRNVSKSSLTSTSITVLIKMDEHDKLKDLDIKTVYTGL